jgi:Na+-transporting NADH:ubiquinone oxidoreductase subunit D
MATGSAKSTFLKGIWSENPVFVQILGICSTLAVTNSVRNTAVMCAGLVYATAFSCLTVSLLRRRIPGRIRMMVEVLIIAGYVLVVDLALKAYVPDISRQLGPYVGLIITNCIVMGRAEAFALNNRPGLSFVDGFASGLGYAYVLLAISVLRELLGAGTFWGVPVLWAGWVNWTIMIMAPGAFFVLAVIVWIIRGYVMPPPKTEGAKP